LRAQSACALATAQGYKASLQAMERKTHVQQQQAKASCHAPWTNATIQHATSPKRWTSNAVTE
jgi:hypothetical protein